MHSLNVTPVIEASHGHTLSGFRLVGISKLRNRGTSNCEQVG